MMKIVYGPVPSWRFGRSIGVDLISREDNICSFDCAYCQLGNTKEKTIERRIFVETDRIRRDLLPLLEKTEADIVTFSGTGEPTLALNLGEAVETVRGITDLTIAILTNSSMMFMEDVKKSLLKFDRVVAKLDAPNDQILQSINRPISEISYKRILAGIKGFGKIFKGNLALQMMFIDDNIRYAEEMADIALEIGPEEVQINTPTRPCPVQALSPGQMEEINKIFEDKGLKTVSVYRKTKPDVEPVDLKETLMRRPVL
ncbi:MAG: radical SAM protein [Halobacteriota archaeon]|nr:radical SAM protein [Halobacteriota archaeon]